MNGSVWVDGVLNGGVPGDDPGLLLGLTVFETFRCYGDRVFRLSEHMSRMERSAEMFEIELPPREQIHEDIDRAIRPNHRIRYTVTAGGHRIVDSALVDPARVQMDIALASFTWHPSKWLPGAVKHGSRAAWMLGASKLNVDELLLVDPDGYILEASRSNIIGVVKGTIVTPPIDGRFLSGVTRAAMLDAALAAGLRLEERPVRCDEDFDELYCSSTLKELAPVTRLDNFDGPGSGPVGKALLAGFHALVAAECSA